MYINTVECATLTWSNEFGPTTVGQVLAVDVEKVRGGVPWAHLLQGEKDPQRAAVTDAFMQYRKLCAHEVLRAESFLPPKKGTVCLFASRACFFL